MLLSDHVPPFLDVPLSLSILSQCFEHCFIWFRDLEKIGAEIFRELDMWYWRRMEKIKCSEKVTNQQVHERIGEKRTLLNENLR